MILSQLLRDSERHTFMEQHFSRLPYVEFQGCRDLVTLGTWSAVERIIQQPSVDLIVGRGGDRWEGTLPKCLAEAKAALAAGFTLGIRKAQRHDDRLAELASSFHVDFLAPIDIHIYCTPGGASGFGWHYDAEDVFILQTHGTKEWRLRKNTVNPWPLVETLPSDMRYDREIMPLQRATLAAGDWLYIPPGYWHRTEAGDESISLSIGIQSRTGIDVFDFLRPRLLDSLRWRERLPPAGAASRKSQDELVAAYSARFTELGKDFADLLRRPELVREFLAAVANSG
jgi:ribosomal protein L16 Arg81 hydroxylase